MSKEALIKREGKWVPVPIGKVTKEDVTNEIRCNGKINESEAERCDAPMRIKWSTSTGEPLEYTQAKNKDHPHRLGCEHDRRSSKKIRSKLDMRCKKMKKEVFLEKMLAKKEEEGWEPGGHGPVVPPHHGPDQHDPNNPDGEKEIVVKKRKPKTMIEVIQTLRSLKPNNIYMDHSVKEWIVAENTIAHYLSEKPLPQEYVIALGQPVTQNKAKVNVNVRQNEWILADVTFTREVRQNHLFFKLHLTAAGKKFLYDHIIKDKDNSKKYYFGICARWQRNTTDPNILEAYNVSRKMLFLVPRDKEKLEKT